jgi:hypothetical protein
MQSLREFRLRHKLTMQSVALVIMIVTPLPIYVAAQAGAGAWLSVLLATMVLSMALAIWAG